MGSRIIFLIIKGLSWIPDFILVILSRILAYLIRDIAGYRTEVVRQNLKNSFPTMDDAGRETLFNQFYRQFAEIFS